MVQNSITISSLTKKFGDFTAVDKISLSIPEGEIFGFLGPNGAGKTTTIKMLSTLLKPTSGKAKVCGFDVSSEKDAVRKLIGIVFQDQALDDELTGEENLDFHARMYGMDAKSRKDRISYVLDLVDLKNKAKIFVKSYSGGMRRRLEIARGLMHFPKVLFLDEPTLGLDPQTRRKIWDYIEKLNKKEKMTILLTTHYMEEADSLCKRVGIIDKGKIIIVDTPAKLKSAVGEDVIRLESDSPKKLSELLKKRFPGSKLKVYDSSVELGVRSGETKIPEVIKAAESKGVKIKSINLSKPNLEDVFIGYTGKSMREEEASKSDNFRLVAKAWGRR